MISAVVAGDESWQRHLEALAEVDAAEAKLSAELRALTVEHEARMAAWRHEVAEARCNLQVAPEPPPEPVEVRATRDALLSVGMRRQRLQGERVRLLANLAPDVEDEWAETREGLAGEVSRVVAALVPTLETLRAWQRTLSEVRTAVDASVPGGGRVINGPSARMPSSVDLTDVLRLADDVDPLAPAPLPPPPLGAVEVDRGEPEVLAIRRDAGRGGFTWGRR